MKKATRYLLLIANLLAWLVTPKLVQQEQFPTGWFLLRAFILIGSVVFAWLQLGHLAKRAMAEWKKNVLLTVISVVSVFYLLETVFMFLPVSQGINLAYCSKIWFQKYWHLNQQRYRDREYSNQDFDPKRKKIFFIGDSYTAGHGINDPANRVSDLVGVALEPNYAVFNFGQNGSDTKDETRRLLEVPFKPDIVVWQHCMNDIEYLGNSKAQLYQKMTNSESIFDRLFAFVANYSFACNYTYWNYKVATEAGLSKAKMKEEDLFFKDAPDPFQKLRMMYYTVDSVHQLLDQTELGCYLDTVIYKQHISDLLVVDSVCKAHQIKLLMLFYPYSDDRSLSTMKDHLVRRLERSVAAHGISTVDVYATAWLLKERNRVVSHLDPHPSEAWNILVADSVIKRIRNQQ